MKRRLVGLVLVVTLSFGFAPSALAHDGSHDFWEACSLGGSGLAFIVTAVVTKRVASPANLSPAATRVIQGGTAAAGAGNAGGFYKKYFSHVVNFANKAQGKLFEANSGTPNLLYGARP